MKYIRGFFMAWGNFMALPCPYRKWHEEARRAMLCMLPLMGLLMGSITAVLLFVLEVLGAPPLLTGVLLTAAYFMMTGFIHVDGFMDCSDAIMSRRPDMAERQRILKDPAVGAFAVVAVCMMFMIFAASMVTLAGKTSVQGIFVIPVIFAVSRALAADAVMRYPVMGTSQYSDMKDRGGDMTIAERLILCLVGILPIIVIYQLAVRIFAGGSGGAIGGAGVIGVMGDPGGLIVYFGSVAAVLIAETIACHNDRKQLGGMNGDVSGHMIVTGETAGLLAAALLTSVFL